RAYVGRLAADLDGRDTGNDLRRTHGDEHAIRPGVAFEEHVGTADVRVGANAKRDQHENHDRAFHRRTFRIASPSASPSALVTTAATSANANPRTRESSGMN